MMNEKKYGLDADVLKNILAVFDRYDKISEVILFGSRAKGNSDPGSDIDLVLKGDNLETNDIIDISLQLDDLELPYKFDLVIYNQIEEQALLDHISRVGITLFSVCP